MAISEWHSQKKCTSRRVAHKFIDQKPEPKNSFFFLVVLPANLPATFALRVDRKRKKTERNRTESYVHTLNHRIQIHWHIYGRRTSHGKANVLQL